MEKYSVIIPAYNCEKTIENTVNSILASGLDDFEIIIVDDGSIDGTASICDNLSTKNEYISCVHQPNAGVSSARNQGIKIATGDYLWFFDADDSVDENSLCQIAEKIEKCSPDMLVFGMSFDYYHNGKMYRRDNLVPPMEGLASREECRKQIYELYLSNSLSSLWNKLIKRKIILDIEFFLREDMFLFEDLEFSLRVIDKCDLVYFLPKAIYRYKQPEDNIKGSSRIKRFSHVTDIIEKFEPLLSDEKSGQKILISLYLILMSWKISVASEKEIGIICEDFFRWIDENSFLNLIKGNEYAMMVYYRQISKIIAKRKYTKIRHCVANWIKQNIGDFRKWKYH